MEINDYQKCAMMTQNPDLDHEKMLTIGTMGLCGEAGEVIDLLKKHLAQGHPLDQEHMIEELGDVAWYLAECASALDTDLETVCRKNLEKLKKRYPEGFDTERSIHRQD